MSALGTRIQRYANVHHRLPDRLPDLLLATPGSYDADVIKDAWGRLISYEHHADGTFVLISQGVNGKYPIEERYTVSFPTTVEK
jgi:hypothetical protein